MIKSTGCAENNELKRSTWIIFLDHHDAQGDNVVRRCLTRFEFKIIRTPSASVTAAGKMVLLAAIEHLESFQTQHFRTMFLSSHCAEYWESPREPNNGSKNDREIEK